MPLQPETFQEECQSEDEGIVDYKLGGYHPVYIGYVFMTIL